MAGPTVLPRYCAPFTTPSERLICESGTLTLVSAMAAGMKPENRPWNKNASAMCHGACANTRMSVVMLAKNRARTNMILRPKRSATMPHAGPLTTRARPSVVLPMATQKTASASLLAPRSWTYSGRNGIQKYVERLAMPTPSAMLYVVPRTPKRPVRGASAASSSSERGEVTAGG